MVLASIVQSKTTLFVVALLIFMFVNVNGLTSLPMKSSAMTEIYPNLTVHSSILSSFLFLKKEIESTPVGICVLAERYGVKGQTLRKQYKEKISDYRNWNQLEHAHDYLLYKTLEKTFLWMKLV